MSQIGFGEHVSQLAQMAGTEPSIYIEEASYHLQDLDKAANRLARVYQDKGVGLNDIVTIPVPNSFELLVAMLACWKVGAVPSPVSASMPREELANLVESGDSSLVYGVDEGLLPGRQTLPKGYQPAVSISDRPLPPLTEHGGERALASSGSTGMPKLIMPTDKAVYDPEFISALFKPEKAAIVPGPLYHAVPFSSCWQAIFNGCKVVLLKKFDAETCLQLIEKHKVDRMWVVPTIMLRIWRLGDEVRNKYDVSSLKNVLSGGAPLPAWLMQSWIDWLGAEKLNDVFGPSERIGGTMINGVEWLTHPGSVGKPLAYAKMKILDENGNECPPGVMGEIYNLPATGHGTTYQYKGKAKSKRTADGWESVGDMGYMDEDGYLYLGDRQSDMILLNGRNVYPAEVEGAIDQHEAVRSCVVFGLPDELSGNRVYAVVDTAGKTVSEEDMKMFLKEKLTPYKIPASFEFVNEPLRNDAGKVRRSALRAERLEKI